MAVAAWRCIRFNCGGHIFCIYPYFLVWSTGKIFFYARFQLSAFYNITWSFILISLSVKQQGNILVSQENFNFQVLLQAALKTILSSQAVCVWLSVIVLLFSSGNVPEWWSNIASVLQTLYFVVFCWHSHLCKMMQNRPMCWKFWSEHPLHQWQGNFSQVISQCKAQPRGKTDLMQNSNGRKSESLFRYVPICSIM